MPVYKIWSRDRLKKTCVVAKSLDEVKEKGTQKLGLSSTDVRLVLAEDGTEIDEDEIFQEFVGETFIILQQGQVWLPSSQTECTSSTLSPPSASVHPVYTVGAESASNQPLKIAPHSPETLLASSESHHETPVLHEWKSMDSVVLTSEIVSAPLPPFSDRVKHFLDTVGRAESIWNVVIAEAAQYYISKWPKIGDRTQYQAIGEKMTARYPCLKQEGKTPWAQFTKSLSQKIRHIRHQNLRRSQDPLPKAKKVFCLSVKEEEVEHNEPPADKEDVGRHIAEIAEIWSKSKPKDLTHTKQLIKATQTYRKQILSDYPDGQLKPVFDKFPCFKEGSLITYELKLKLGVDRVRLFASNMKKMVTAIGSIMSDEHKDVPKIRDVFKYLEERTTKVKTQKDSFITILEDVADKHISKHLKTNEMDPLKLVVFVTNDDVVGCYIIGGNHIIEVSSPTCVMTGVFELMAAYYVFDIDYPIIYANALGAIQEITLEEMHHQTTTKRYRFFMKELKAEMRKITVKDQED